MTKIYLVTGFLGSGKTTFLNYRLSQSKAKVGVLMNEFGKISMDTIAVQDAGVDLVELKNGSIFCSCLKEHFIEGLEKLIGMNLDEIYIESSGLSDPSDMNKVIKVLSLSVSEELFEFMGTLCIVDGMFFKQELEKMVNVRRQIKHSNHILINKTDLITKEQLKDIIELIHEINKDVEITPIAHGVVDFDEIKSSYYFIEDEESTNTVDSKPKTIIIKFLKQPTMEQLKGFLVEMSSFFFRVKGYMEVENTWCKVDLVNEQINIVEYQKKNTDKTNERGFNELVFLSSKGIASISHLAQTAEKLLSGLYTIEM